MAKKVISIVLILALCIGTCYAATEGDLCTMLTKPIIYLTNNYYYCGYLYNLVIQRDSYVSEINKQKNLLASYATQEQALKKSLGVSAVGAAWDSVYTAVSLASKPITLGSLASLDVAVVTDLACNVNDLAATYTQLKALKSNTLTALNALKTAETSYNNYQTKINSHIKKSGHLCFKFVSP